MFISPISVSNYNRNPVSFGSTSIISRSVNPSVKGEIAQTILAKMKKVVSLPGTFKMPEYKIAENYVMSAEKSKDIIQVFIESLGKEKNSLMCTFDKNGILREATYKSEETQKSFSRSYNNKKRHLTGEGGRFLVDRKGELIHVHGKSNAPAVNNEPLDELYWALSGNLVSIMK